MNIIVHPTNWTITYDHSRSMLEFQTLINEIVHPSEKNSQGRTGSLVALFPIIGINPAKRTIWIIAFATFEFPVIKNTPKEITESSIENQSCIFICVSIFSFVWKSRTTDNTQIIIAPPSIIIGGIQLLEKSKKVITFAISAISQILKAMTDGLKSLSRIIFLI